MALHPGRGIPGTGFFQKNAAVLPLVLLCLMVWTGPARAVDAGTMVYTVSDTVVVRARAMGDAITPSAAGMVTIIDLEDESGSKDLAEILGRTAGFQVRHHGGLGFAGVPSLRGSSAAQIRIFIDGLPLNDAQSGTVDLSLLPVERFSRAEIHRGVVPGGLGGMGGAGAVNLITRSQADGLDAGVFAGGFGSLGGRMTWGASSNEGDRSILLMGHGRRADNDYQYLDNNQTFLETGDDTVRVRQNAWFEEWGLWGSSRMECGPLDIRAVAGWFRKDGGRPGPINYPSPSATVRLDRLDGQVQISLPPQLTLEFSTAKVEQFLFDPNNEIDDGFGGDIHSLNNDLTGRISWTPNLWKSHSSGSFISLVNLTAGVERRSQWYNQWYGADEDPRRNRHTDSAFAALPMVLFDNNLQLTPAWRFQRNTDDFPPLPALPWLPEDEDVKNIRHDVSPSVGLVWEVQPDTWFVEAHAGQSVRIPTWVELFGHRGGIDGNRELSPEEITALDVALVWKPSSGFSSRLSAFQAQTDDAIIFVQNSPGTSHAQNIGATRNRGLEWEGQFLLPHKLHLQANATWQDPVDLGEIPHLNGNSLPYLSDVEIDARLTRPVGFWRLWVELSHESSKYRDRANTELIKAPARTRWNLGVTRLIGNSLEISAEVINLTDDRTYDVVQFPLPGRTWQVAMRVNR